MFFLLFENLYTVLYRSCEAPRTVLEVTRARKVASSFDENHQPGDWETGICPRATSRPDLNSTERKKFSSRLARQPAGPGRVAGSVLKGPFLIRPSKPPETARVSGQISKVDLKARTLQSWISTPGPFQFGMQPSNYPQYIV